MSEHDHLVQLLMSLDGAPDEPVVVAEYQAKAATVLASLWLRRRDATRRTEALEPVRVLVESGRWSVDMIEAAVGLSTIEHWADCHRRTAGCGDCTCPPNNVEARARAALPVVPPIRPPYRAART